MALRLCLAGATGWAGGALARAVARAEDIELVAGVSRTHAGKSIGDLLSVPGLNVILSDSAREALKDECDVSPGWQSRRLRASKASPAR